MYYISKYILINLAKFVGNHRIPKLSNIAAYYSEYELSEYVIMEQTVLKLLDYKLDYDTVYSILRLMLASEDKDFESFALRLLNHFIEDIRFVDFSPLESAMAIISLTCDILKSTNVKRQVLKCYDIQSTLYMNCYIVIKRYLLINLVYICLNLV
jgi:hypothetical protein